MTRVRLVLTVATLCAVAGAVVAAQQVPDYRDRQVRRAEPVPARNPLQGDADAIRAGQGIFRGRGCAECHGMNGTGVRGPDLTQVWATGRTDDGLFRTIAYGVQGTEMVANPRMFDHEIWQILAYLRTLAAPAPSDPLRGDARNGEKLFRTHCVACHRVSNAGGRLGPDLSRVGVARARLAIVNRVRGRVEGDPRAGFAPVTLTPHAGAPIQGVKKNEDLFSVQIMDVRERIQGYEKAKLKALESDITQSAMPAFGVDKLSNAELDDLVSYLQTLRGFNPAVVE